MAEPGPSQAGSRLLSGFNCGSSIVCNSIFSLLRPSLTCAINSVNISPGSAPRRRQKEHQEDAHPHTHRLLPHLVAMWPRTLRYFSLPLSEWICNLMSSTDTLKFSSSLATLFSSSFLATFLLLSCYFLALCFSNLIVMFLDILSRWPFCDHRFT